MNVNWYFDFLSPYSYLSWSWVKKNYDSDKYHFSFVPVVLSKIIKSYDTKGPAEIEPKRIYLYKDCLRFAADNNIPFCMPAELPFNSLYALRIIALLQNKEDQIKAIDCIYTAGWAEGKDIGSPEVLEGLLNNVGLDGKALLEGTGTKEVRKTLKNNCKVALEQGVFGLPSFVANDELFWGNDSIKYLERFLSGKDLGMNKEVNYFIKEFKV